MSNNEDINNINSKDKGNNGQSNKQVNNVKNNGISNNGRRIINIPQNIASKIENQTITMESLKDLTMEQKKDKIMRKYKTEIGTSFPCEADEVYDIIREIDIAILIHHQNDTRWIYNKGSEAAQIVRNRKMEKMRQANEKANKELEEVRIQLINKIKNWKGLDDWDIDDIVDYMLTSHQCERAINDNQIFKNLVDMAKNTIQFENNNGSDTNDNNNNNNNHFSPINIMTNALQNGMQQNDSDIGMNDSSSESMSDSNDFDNEFEENQRTQNMVQSQLKWDKEKERMESIRGRQDTNEINYIRQLRTVNEKKYKEMKNEKFSGRYEYKWRGIHIPTIDINVEREQINAKNKKNQLSIIALTKRNNQLFWDYQQAFYDLAYNNVNSDTFLDDDKVFDNASGQMIHFENDLLFNFKNVVIKAARNVQIDLNINPKIVISGLSDNFENEQNFFHFKFNELCMTVGGPWAEFEENDVITFRLRKPNNVFEYESLTRKITNQNKFNRRNSDRNYIKNKIKSNVMSNNNIESGINFQNINKTISYEDAMNCNDNITYYINENDKNYTVKNGQIDFMSKINNKYHVIIYLNPNGKWFQKYGDNMGNALNTAINAYKTSEYKYDEKEEIDENTVFNKNFNKLSFDYLPTNKEFEIQMDLPMNQYNDYGNQMKLYDIVTKIFKINNNYNKNKKEEYKNIHHKTIDISKIKHVFRHKRRSGDNKNNNQPKSMYKNDDMKEENETIKEKKRKYKDRISVVFEGVLDTELPYIIPLILRPLYLERKNQDKSSLEEICDQLYQCDTCGGPNCKKNKCPFFNIVKKERENYKKSNPKLANLKTMGKFCGKCGYIGGHWLNNWKCPNKKHCSLCCSDDHYSTKSMDCPLWANISILCNFFKKEFELNLRNSKYNENNGNNATWIPQTFEYLPSYKNYRHWQTVKQQISVVYNEIQNIRDSQRKKENRNLKRKETFPDLFKDLKQRFINDKIEMEKYRMKYNLLERINNENKERNKEKQRQQNELRKKRLKQRYQTMSQNMNQNRNKNNKNKPNSHTFAMSFGYSNMKNNQNRNKNNNNLNRNNNNNNLNRNNNNNNLNQNGNHNNINQNQKGSNNNLNQNSNNNNNSNESGNNSQNGKDSSKSGWSQKRSSKQRKSMGRKSGYFNRNVKMNSKKNSGIKKTVKNNNKIQHKIKKNINRNDKKNIDKSKQVRSASMGREKNTDIEMGGPQSNDLDDEVARNSAYRRNNMPIPNAATGHKQRYKNRTKRHSNKINQSSNFMTGNDKANRELLAYGADKHFNDDYNGNGSSINDYENDNNNNIEIDGYDSV